MPDYFGLVFVFRVLFTN